MKLLLLLAVSCLTLHNGKGAPSTAVYNFVRCSPEGNEANCVTHQSAEMTWNPDLPAKLPPSAAQYLEAEPVEDESPQREEEEEDEEEIEEEETPMTSEEGESPGAFLLEEGSGGSEGSAAGDVFIADKAPWTAESETGSGENNMDQQTGEDMRSVRPFIRSRFLAGAAKPAEHELRDDHLLQL